MKHAVKQSALNNTHAVCPRAPRVRHVSRSRVWAPGRWKTVRASSLAQASTMKFGKRFAQALPVELAPFALPYTVRDRGWLVPQSRSGGSHRPHVRFAHRPGRHRNTRGARLRHSACLPPALRSRASRATGAVGHAAPTSESAPACVPAAAAPGAPTPRAPLAHACGPGSCTGCSRAAPARALGPGGWLHSPLAGALSTERPARSHSRSPTRRRATPPPTQPLKQYLKALVMAAADGSTPTGDESGETSSGGEGYTSGGLLDSSAPPPSFKPTSRQVADFQQRLKGASCGQRLGRLCSESRKTRLNAT